jgi:hypothetical protein
MNALRQALEEMGIDTAKIAHDMGMPLDIIFPEPSAELSEAFRQMSLMLERGRKSEEEPSDE